MNKIKQVIIALILGSITAFVFVVGLGFAAVLGLVALVGVLWLRFQMSRVKRSSASATIHANDKSHRVFEGQYTVMDEHRHH